MPEIALKVCELHADSSLGPQIRLNVNHPALALFFRHTVNQQNLLPALHFGAYGQQSTMNAHCICFGNIAERPVVRRPAVNTHWNRQRQTLAASLLPKFVHPASQGENGLPFLKVVCSLKLGNSTRVQLFAGAGQVPGKESANFRETRAKMNRELLL